MKAEEVDHRARLADAWHNAEEMLSAGRRWPQTSERLREYQQIIDLRIRFGEPVTQPICLISQIQRSGGTLLSQLFDGHPQLHAYPLELKLNKPKFRWPALDLSSAPEEWFAVLQGEAFVAAFRNGYSKAEGPDADGERFPMLLPPELRRSLFLRLAPLQGTADQRDILDTFLTSFFGAWLDNQNLYREPKRWVSAFTARLIMEERSVDGFFRDYPDGRIISVVRDPKSWYRSARRQRPALYGEVDTAVALWRRSTESALALAAREPERVRVLLFEDLVSGTPTLMRGLADWLEIEFRPELLEPTFNAMPIRANSSFDVSGYGVLTDRLSSGKRRDPEQERLGRALSPLYDRAAAAHGAG